MGAEQKHVLCVFVCFLCENDHMKGPNSLKNNARHMEVVCASMPGVWVMQWWPGFDPEVAWGVDHTHASTKKTCFCECLFW